MVFQKFHQKIVVIFFKDTHQKPVSYGNYKKFLQICNLYISMYVISTIEIVCLKVPSEFYRKCQTSCRMPSRIFSALHSDGYYRESMDFAENVPKNISKTSTRISSMNFILNFTFNSKKAIPLEFFLPGISSMLRQIFIMDVCQQSQNTSTVSLKCRKNSN